MRELGSRAWFQVTQHPTMSLTHPDFEGWWSAAEDLGMLVYVHVFFSRSGGSHPSWANNGRGIAAYREGVVPADQRPADIRNFLNAMVFDGVFERHPKLMVLIAECGFSWLPPMAHEFDQRVKGIGADGVYEGELLRAPVEAVGVSGAPGQGEPVVRLRRHGL